MVLGWTTFATIDLTGAKGLEASIHHGPSSIGLDGSCGAALGFGETRRSIYTDVVYLLSRSRLNQLTLN